MSENPAPRSHAVDAAGRHRAVQDVAQWFDYEHLRGPARNVSQRVASLADTMLGLISADGPELTTGLRKLLEAKDCLVRAAIAATGDQPS